MTSVVFELQSTYQCKKSRLENEFYTVIIVEMMLKNLISRDDLKEEIGSKVISTLINYCNQPCCLPLILKQSKAMAIMITKIGINTALAPSSSILFMTTKL
ncbi:MAG: hypothetical protein ACI9W0_000414 [Gammaproteobacteria bacterium]